MIYIIIAVLYTVFAVSLLVWDGIKTKKELEG